jgi:hypothetical protein
MTSIRLPVGSYEHRSHPASTARLKNCFIEALPSGAKTPAVLLRAPGITGTTTVGNGPIQGMHYGLGFIFVVSGGSLYKVDSNLSATLLGSVGSATQTSIDMEHNVDTLVVVNSPDAFYYDTTTSTFGQIADADFTSRGASDVEFCDNWLLFVEPNSGRFFGADLGDATSYDALNFATAEGSPDNLVGMKVDHRQVILFGLTSIEIWENSGAAGFPFTRAINGFIEIGCLNNRTIAKLDNSVYWLANDYTVRRLEGATPVRVSQHAIEQALTAVTISQGKAFTYAQEGHLFYVLIFPERTFVLDVTTGEWADRESYGYDYWIAKCHAQAFNREYVGSSIDNKIGYLNTTDYDEWGSTQVMEWTYQPIYAEGQRAFHDRLEIIMETGVGLVTGQGSSPTVMLAYSDDGGIIWVNLPTRSAGAIGQYRWRVVWHRLGSSRMRVYRASISDPVKVCITDTIVEIRSGRL